MSRLVGQMDRAFFVRGLVHAAGRTHRAVVMVELSKGLDRAAVLSVAGAGVLLGESLVRWGWGAWSGHVKGLVAVAWVACVLAMIARRVVAGLRKKPVMREVAERLDLAAGTHNQIATALEFSAQPTPSAFARAAIADGARLLESHGDLEPLVPVVAWHGRRNGWWVSAAGMMVGVSMVLPQATRGEAGPGVTVSPGGVNVLGERVAAEDSQRDRRKEPASKPVAAAHTAARADGGSLQAAMHVPASGTAAPSGAGGNATGGHAAGEAGAAGEQSQRGATAKTGQTPTRQKTVAQASKDEPQGAASASSSAVGSGRAGGGASQRAENDWQQRDSTEGTPSDGSDAANTETEPNNGDTHHGGLQPMLQDRNQAPSRELSLGSLGAAGGDGRGGPTPPKKSRGAGAMLMAVPQPDFVPAPLLPGSSKVVHVSGEPQRVDHAALAVAQATGRSGQEPLVPRTDVPPEQSEYVQRYFEMIHRDEMAPAVQGASEEPTKRGVE